MQNARKEANFNITDRVVLSIQASSEIMEVIELHKAFIEEQTLSKIEVFDTPKYAFKGQVLEEEVEIMFK